MKIPRDIGASELIKLLKKYDYNITRQTGSHIRLTTLQNGQHHVTIPNHNHIKIGTFSSIMNDIANHLQIPKDKFIKSLFG